MLRNLLGSILCVWLQSAAGFRCTDDVGQAGGPHVANRNWREITLVDADGCFVQAAEEIDDGSSYHVFDTNHGEIRASVATPWSHYLKVDSDPPGAIVVALRTHLLLRDEWSCDALYFCYSDAAVFPNGTRIGKSAPNFDQVSHGPPPDRNLLHYDFIEVGTSDFNTEIQHAHPMTRGLSIEPMHTYLERLPDLPLVKKLPMAVSDRDSELQLFYVSPDDIAKHNIDEWIKGCNSIQHPHPTAWHYLKYFNLTYLMRSITVRSVTFGTLVSEHSVGSIGHLKVDTEGHDPNIIRSMVQYCEQHPGTFPKMITFEANQLTSDDEKSGTLGLLSKHGYVVLHDDQYDVQMVRCQPYFHKSNLL